MKTRIECVPLEEGLRLGREIGIREAQAGRSAFRMPRLSQVPGLLMARRFRSAGAAIAGSGDRKYVAIYHLTSPEVSESAAWKEAALTPWTRKMQPHMKDVLRLRLKRYAPARTYE